MGTVYVEGDLEEGAPEGLKEKLASVKLRPEYPQVPTGRSSILGDAGSFVVEGACLFAAAFCLAASRSTHFVGGIAGWLSGDASTPASSGVHQSKSAGGMEVASVGDSSEVSVRKGGELVAARRDAVDLLDDGGEGDSLGRTAADERVLELHSRRAVPDFGAPQVIGSAAGYPEVALVPRSNGEMLLMVRDRSGGDIRSRFFRLDGETGALLEPLADGLSEPDLTGGNLCYGGKFVELADGRVAVLVSNGRAGSCSIFDVDQHIFNPDGASLVMDPAWDRPLNGTTLMSRSGYSITKERLVANINGDGEAWVRVINSDGTVSAPQRVDLAGAAGSSNGRIAVAEVTTDLGAAVTVIVYPLTNSGDGYTRLMVRKYDLATKSFIGGATQVSLPAECYNQGNSFSLLPHKDGSGFSVVFAAVPESGGSDFFFRRQEFEFVSGNIQKKGGVISDPASSPVGTLDWHGVASAPDVSGVQVVSGGFTQPVIIRELMTNGTLSDPVTVWTSGTSVPASAALSCGGVAAATARHNANIEVRVAAGVIPPTISLAITLTEGADPALVTINTPANAVNIQVAGFSGDPALLTFDGTDSSYCRFLKNVGSVATPDWQPATIFSKADIDAGLIRLESNDGEENPVVSLDITDANVACDGAVFSETLVKQVNYIHTDDRPVIGGSHELSFPNPASETPQTIQISILQLDPTDPDSSVVDLVVGESQRIRMHFCSNEDQTLTSVPSVYLATNSTNRVCTTYYDGEGDPSFKVFASAGGLSSDVKDVVIRFPDEEDADPITRQEQLYTTIQQSLIASGVSAGLAFLAFAARKVLNKWLHARARHMVNVHEGDELWRICVKPIALKLFDPAFKPNLCNWFGSLGKDRARKYLEKIGQMVRAMQSCDGGFSALDADSFGRLRKDYRDWFRDAVVTAVAAYAGSPCCRKCRGADLEAEDFNPRMAKFVVEHMRTEGLLDSDLLDFLDMGTTTKQDKLFNELGYVEEDSLVDGKGCCSCCFGGHDDRVRTGSVRGSSKVDPHREERDERRVMAGAVPAGVVGRGGLGMVHTVYGSVGGDSEDSVERLTGVMTGTFVGDTVVGGQEMSMMEIIEGAVASDPFMRGLAPGEV